MSTRALFCLIVCFWLFSYAKAQDLIITNVELNSNNPVPAGGQVSYGYDVRNIGTASAAASRVRFYFSTGTNPANALFTFGGSDFVPSLAAGARSDENVFLTIPTNTSPGTYNILLVADADDDVTEAGASGESNNVVVRQITVVAPGPDLFAFNADVPTSINTNQTFDVTATVGNQGTLNAGSSVLAVYASTNNSFEAGTDVLLGTINLAGVDTNPGNRPRPTVSTTAGWPGAITGNAYVLFRVDDGEEITELEEGNNVLASPVTVSNLNPDLIVTNTSIGTSTPTIGQPVFLFATIRNNGTTTAPGTVLNYWFSENNFIDENSILVGTRNITALGAGVSRVANFSVRVPPQVTPGNYFILFQADANDDANEGFDGEANNITANGIAVVAAGGSPAPGGGGNDDGGVTAPRLAGPGLEQPSLQAGTFSLSTYPNPAKGSTTVSLGAVDNYNVQLVDAQGRQVLQRQVQNANSTSLDLTGLKKGIYLLKAQGTAGVKTQRLVVQ